MTGEDKNTEKHVVNPNLSDAIDGTKVEKQQHATSYDDVDRGGFRRIIKNFTPSSVQLSLQSCNSISPWLIAARRKRWFIITMSTGVTSILLHQLPYNGSWLRIISTVFFVLNLFLFLLFTFITCLRYTLYPRIFPAVLRHPHQSLFLATFPVGLATLINMIVLVCAPVWGHGWAIFAWVLWWIDSVMALIACFHLMYNM